jgi:acyl dehydratase
MSQLENVSYEEITIGQTASYSKTVSEQDIQLFAIISGDANPVHLDEAYASGTQFQGRIAHGMLTGALVSAAIATKLPGPGSVYLGQSLRFRAPVKIDDHITVKLEVTEKNDRRKFLTLDCKVYNQHEKLVASGTADVMAPEEKLCLEAPAMPAVQLVPD